MQVRTMKNRKKTDKEATPVLSKRQVETETRKTDKMDHGEKIGQS